MDKYFDIITKTRQVFSNLVEGLSIEQLNAIPAGFNNNILWNFAHIMVTPQILCYKLSGLPFTVEESLVDGFKKGTKPVGFISEAEFKHIKELEKWSINKLIEDYKSGIFQTYNVYTNSFHIEQTSVEDAIQFSSVHDGVHLGYAMALRRLVQ